VIWYVKYIKSWLCRHSNVCIFDMWLLCIWLSITLIGGGRKSTDVRDDGKKEQRWLERYLDALGVKAEEKKSEWYERAKRCGHKTNERQGTTPDRCQNAKTNFYHDRNASNGAKRAGIRRKSWDHIRCVCDVAKDHLSQPGDVSETKTGTETRKKHPKQGCVPCFDVSLYKKNTTPVQHEKPQQM
jgi:hypothetical protein